MRAEDDRRYRVIRPLGALYQADIFLAERSGAEGFTKQVALWKVRPELSQQTKANTRLHEDLRSAAKLSTSLVTHILDVVGDDAALEIVVEHLNGVSLDEAANMATERSHRLTDDMVLSVALEVARALESAHEPQLRRGSVLHGDIRPQNVLLGRQGTVKLTGFGFARFLTELEPSGRFATWDGWCYQPPERVLQAISDERSDVFSLGCVLLELIGGVRPWMTADSDSLIQLLRDGAHPMGEGVLRSSKELTKIVRRACEPDPTERFQSAEEFAEALHGLLFERRIIDGTARFVRAFFEAYAEPLPVTGDEEDTVTTTMGEVSVVSSEIIAETTARRAPPVSPLPKPAGNRFTGRVDVLRRLSQLLVSASRGAGAGVVIEGQPGYGRTRLLDEIALRLASSEQRRAWLSMRALPTERGVPFSGLLRLFGALLGQAPNRSLDEIGEAAEQLRVYGLDEYAIAAIRAAAGVGEPIEASWATGLFTEAVATAIVGLSQEQLTIIAWDDVQLMDEASLACLKELVSAIGDKRVLVLMTKTPEFELPWQLATMVHLELGPLELERCEDFVLDVIRGATRVDPTLLEALVAHTEGSPLLLGESLKLLEDAKRLVIRGHYLSLEASSQDEPLPRLEDAMELRLGSMGDEARMIAVSAAVAGAGMSPDVIATATGQDVATVEEQLERLVREYGLLEREPAGYAFVHERLRRALLDASSTTVIQTQRATVARALLDRSKQGSGLDEYAASLLIRCGEEEEAAKVFSECAARNEEEGNPESALARYQRAHELLAGGGESADFELAQLMGIGRTAFQAMRFDVAEGALEAANELAERLSDSESGAEACIVLLQLLGRQGRLGDVMELAKDAIPLAESTGNALLLARAYGAIGDAYQQWGQYGPDLRYIEAAVSFASESGDPVQLGHFLQLAVTHAAGVGEDEQTRVLLEQIRPIVEANDEPSLRGQLLKGETLLAIFARDYEEAVKKALEGIELARSTGQHQLEVLMLHNAGDASLRLGREREALYYFTESLRRTRAGRYDRLTEMNEMFIGFIEASSLGQEAGLMRIRKAIELAKKQGRIWNLQQGHELLGKAMAKQGDQTGARPHLQKALRYAKESGVRFFIEESTMALESLGDS